MKSRAVKHLQSSIVENRNSTRTQTLEPDRVYQNSVLAGMKLSSRDCSLQRGLVHSCVTSWTRSLCCRLLSPGVPGAHAPLNFTGSAKELEVQAVLAGTREVQENLSHHHCNAVFAFPQETQLSSGGKKTLAKLLRGLMRLRAVDSQSLLCLICGPSEILSGDQCCVFIRDM